ncbi:MAG: DUF1844 domain-containing protein [Caldiserica bacterium]|nr:DUF1844 domain-containing protein [Caldisericota bacterium]
MEKESDARFLAFINQLYLGGMAHLGKLPNPATGKIERNLEVAHETIETLRMVERKTRGNLSREEENMLKSFLTNLQLNYVEEFNKKEPAKEKSQEKKKEKDTKK